MSQELDLSKSTSHPRRVRAAPSSKVTGRTTNTGERGDRVWNSGSAKRSRRSLLNQILKFGNSADQLNRTISREKSIT